jgi:hypothetical protein
MVASQKRSDNLDRATKSGFGGILALFFIWRRDLVANMIPDL